MSFSEIKKYIQDEIGFLPFVFAVIMVAKILGVRLWSMPDIVGYVAIIMLTLIFVIKGSSYNKICVVFLAYLPLALALADPPAVFKSWSRLGLFAMIFLSMSPAISSPFAIKYRRGILIATLWLCFLIGFGSFFGKYLGINYMRSIAGEFLAASISSTFGGLTRHSMLLGPVSGIGALYLAYHAMRRQKKIYWLAVIPCLGSVLFASSRAALYAFMAGAIVLLYFFTKSKKVFRKRLLTILLISVVSFPLWDFAMEGINQKQEMELDRGYDSRSEKWTARLNEFKESPIWGYGFVAVDERYDEIGVGGIIEPGSSWLAILSMTGIIGFILFCGIFYKAAKNSMKWRTPEGALMASLLIFVGVHMLAEGHIFSGGSYLCFLVWLMIGCATDYRPSQFSIEI